MKPIEIYSLKTSKHGIYILNNAAIVYKKAFSGTYPYSRVTIKLLLPIETIVNLTEKKCRASRAIVLEITKTGKKDRFVTACSIYDNNFKYVVGETVHPKKPFDMSREQCGSGIHFFRTLKEAREYAL